MLGNFQAILWFPDLEVIGEETQDRYNEVTHKPPQLVFLGL